MRELYNRIASLCKARGTNITALCREAGVSRATLSELNAGRTETLTLKTAQKLADALGVSINFLMGDYQDSPVGVPASAAGLPSYSEKAPTPQGERKITEDDIKLALFGGDGEVTDEMWEEAIFAAQLIKERHKRKKD